MNHAMGMIIETLVAMLLVATIGYCMLLNSRLKRLKADEQSLKATIAELITATEIAERAIGGLKVTVRECNENLGSRLEAATDVVSDLDRRLNEGDDLLRRLSRIVSAGKPREPQSVPVVTASVPSAPPPTSPQAIVAAAQAFAERKRAAGLAA